MSAEEDLHFRCTGCGECCRNIRLPLTPAEAVDWLGRGQVVQLLCEAIPWAEEPPVGDVAAAYKRERSFVAQSGELPVRVLVTLVAPLLPRCSFLGEDNRCREYERRPTVCRTYPAQLIPFVTLRPEQRRCPPEAWTGEAPVLLRRGEYVEAELREGMAALHRETVHRVPVLAGLCAVLGIKVAAMANDGFVVHTPPVEALRGALMGLLAGSLPPVDQVSWQLLSHRGEIVEALRELGAQSGAAEQCAGLSCEYLC